MKRFHEKTAHASNGCILWTAAKKQGGYGRFYLDGKLHQAHRIAWMLEHGDIPDGMFVCHRCDNPSCVNHEHLFIGFPADNTQDMLKKGRNGDTGNPGASNGRARLTAPEVRTIRRRLEKGETQRALSEDYGVSPASISMINTRQTWRHLETF